MGTNSRGTRARCAATIALVLVSTGTALAQYEDSPRIPLDEELSYQDSNLEPGLRAGFGSIEKSLMLDKELNRALIWDTIMEGVQLRSVNPEEDPGTVSETIDYIDFTRKMPATIDTKDMITKRFADKLQQRELRSSGNTNIRSQRRWKSKKGKGTQIICYFKLCSFRTPS